MKISGVVVCYNEENVIEHCIQSLSKFCDEIVVFDSFSTDKTLDILNKYNCKVFQHEFDNHRDQKNRAIEKCSNEWVFLLDSDESVEDNLISKLQEMISNDAGIDAFSFPRKNYVDGDGPIGYPDIQTRLFKNYVRHYGHPFHHHADGNAKKHVLINNCGAIIHEKTVDRQKKQNQLYYYFRPQDYKEKPDGVENIKIDLNVIKNPDNVNVYRDFIKKDIGR